jgi:hypothetical protein
VAASTACIKMALFRGTLIHLKQQFRPVLNIWFAVQSGFDNRQEERLNTNPI